MYIKIEEHLNRISSPANLKINDQIKQLREYCRSHKCLRPYHHFAFGQSPFSPHPLIVESLKENADQHSYLPTAGLVELREQIANFYQRQFHFDCHSSQVVVSPGSKEIISIILAVLEGDVIIPVPAWVSYLPQAKILKKNILKIMTSAENNYKLTAEQLLHATSDNTDKQKILILNHPNNPTGCIYTVEELTEIADVCKKQNIIIISDEIYALTTLDIKQFVSMATIYPEGTIVTGGLSKDRSCGGYRLGVSIFPKDSHELIDAILKVAGSTYSCVAAPIQHAAITAYAENSNIDTYMQDCREIVSAVGSKMASLMSEIPGVQTTTPCGGFYLFVNLNDYKDNFRKLGIKSCNDFCENLIAVEHTALLPGDSLLLDENNFSVRCSFVDFDGQQIYEKWIEKRPSSQAERDAFVEKNCPLIIEGVQNIAIYLEQIRNGQLPKHRMGS